MKVYIIFTQKYVNVFALGCDLYFLKKSVII